MRLLFLLLFLFLFFFAHFFAGLFVFFAGAGAFGAAIGFAHFGVGLYIVDGIDIDVVLEGRVKGDSYCLILHLSNMELKRPTEVVSDIKPETNGNGNGKSATNGNGKAKANGKGKARVTGNGK